MYPALTETFGPTSTQKTCHDNSTTASSCMTTPGPVRAEQMPMLRKMQIDADYTNESSTPRIVNGVKIGEGDGTVSLMSLGAMCVEGWKRKRWNPAGLKVTTVEVSVPLLAGVVAVNTFAIDPAQSVLRDTSRRRNDCRSRRHTRQHATQRDYPQSRDRRRRRDPRLVRVEHPRICKARTMGLRFLHINSNIVIEHSPPSKNTYLYMTSIER